MALERVFTIYAITCLAYCLVIGALWIASYLDWQKTGSQEYLDETRRFLYLLIFTFVWPGLILGTFFIAVRNTIKGVR